MGERLLGLGKDTMPGDHCIVDIRAERNLVEGGEKAEIEKGVVNYHAPFLHLPNETRKEYNTHVKITSPIIHRYRVDRRVTTGNCQVGECVGFRVRLDVEEDGAIVVEDSTGFFAAGGIDTGLLGC